MGFKSKFKKDADNLHNKSNSNFDFYLDLKKYDLEKFKFEKEEKDYLFDILPYTIETDKHPDYNKKEKAYNLEIYVHSYIGKSKGSYLCMEQMYGKPCIICEEFRRLKEKYESEGMPNKDVWDNIKDLAYKQRILYYILYKNKRYVFDSSYFSFEKIWKVAVERKETKGINIFPVYLNEEDCTSLEFTYMPKGQSFFDLLNFEFPAIENYNPKHVEGLISLEKLLVIPDQEIIKNSLMGFGENENDSYEEDEEVMNEEEQQEYYDEVIENEDPIRKKKKSVNINECPYARKGIPIFAKSWDEYEACNKCINEHPEIFESCKKANKEIK